MRLLLIISFYVTSAFSVVDPDDLQKARRLHLSLTGTLPKKAQLTDTLNFLKQTKNKEAAINIINNDPNFYNTTIKNFVTPWTNQTGDSAVALNDMSAMMIGLIRDDLSFKEIFYNDMLYIYKGVFLGSVLTTDLRAALTGTDLEFVSTSLNHDFPTLLNATPEDRYADLRVAFPHSDKIVISHPTSPKIRFIISRYSTDRNAHFAEADSLSIGMENTSVFARVAQSDYLHNDPRAIAGIMSTREFGRSYLTAGTNRAAISYMMKYFMCTTMEQLKDGTISDHFVRKDIPRIPGGKESTFKNNCVTCHAGLDPLTNAFSYHDFKNERLIYSYQTVIPKLNFNISNDDVQIGHQVQDDYWANYWREGLNSKMNWGPGTEGFGIKSLGQMLASTEKFSHCMSKRVYEKVCLSNIREIGLSEKLIVDGLTKKFVDSNYNMKSLFAETVVSCKD